MPGKNDEKVIEAAKRVFVRYGYKRTSMADIAEAAGMSRPALYLVFPSKEETLIAVMTNVFEATLDDVRQGLSRLIGIEEKLTFAFDTWIVRGFELVQSSPDAKDLLESSYEFAAEVTSKAAADFVAILAGLLAPLVRKQSKLSLSAVQIAQMLLSAMLGFKASAKDTEHLRKLIAGLIEVVLASLDHKAQTRVSKKLRKSK